MSPARFTFLLLVLLTTARLSALDPSDLSRILDAPELPFSLEVTKGTVSESEDPSFVGGSAIAVRPEFDEEHSAQHIRFDLRIEASGPGVLTFRVRSENSLPHFFNVSSRYSTDMLPQNPQPDTWYDVRVSIVGSTNEIVLAMWPLGRPADSVFYFDDFEYQSGIEISTVNIEEAGTITLSPTKVLYQVGEQIQVSTTPAAGITVESVTSRNLYSGRDTVNPGQFTLTAEENVILTPRYIQELKLDGFDARIRLDDHVANLESSSAFRARSIEILNIPENTLLAFEADTTDFSPLAATSSDTAVYTSQLGRETFDPIREITHHRILIDKPESSIEINPSTSWIPNQYEQARTFRNFALLTEKEIDIFKRGKGQVSVEHAPGEIPGTVSATLQAVPEDGWEFIAWRGAADSINATLTVLIDQPEVIIAEFAQVFRFGNSKWSFLHDGNGSVRLTDDKQGIHIESGESLSVFDLILDIFGQGPFSADLIYLDSEGNQIYSESLFPYDIQVGKAPESQRTSLYLQGGAREIRNIIVSGGSGYDDIPFYINAPNGSFSASPQAELYHHRDLITLNVSDSWKDRFLGWFGDYYSPEQTLDITLERPLQLDAVFQNTISSVTNRSIRTKGTVSLEESVGQDEVNFSPSTFSPNDWEEIEIELTPPLTVAFNFSGETENLQMQFSTAEGELASNQVYRHTDGATYCTLAPGSSGPFRAKFSNTGKQDITGQIAIQGFYRNIDDWVPFGSSNHVRRDPEDRYLPIGSKLKVEAISSNQNSPFNSWIGRSETEDSFELTVQEGDVVTLDPTFRSALPVDGVKDITSIYSSWSRGGGASFQSNSPYAANEKRTVSLQVEGPGVLEFNVYHNYPQNASVLVTNGGEPARPLPNYENPGQVHKILIEPGINLIDITTMLSPEAIESGEQPGYGKIDIVAFIPGFFIGSSDRLTYTVHDGEANNPPMFEAGTSLTITPEENDDTVFNGWKGDLEGQPKSVRLIANRHIIAEFSQNRGRSFGPIGIELSDNAVFNTAGQTEYYIESESGPTTMTFTVPSMTEFSFSLRYAETPTTVKVDGEIIFQGEGFDTNLAFPVKEQPQVIELFFELDPDFDRQLWVNNLLYLQEFSLYGNFGDKQETVSASPDKESYSPGEKVTVQLNSSAANDWVFYDVGVSLPTLGLFEWNEAATGKRSFELEMVSQTELIGKVGPAPSRQTGDLVPAANLTLINSASKAPDGSTTKSGTVIEATYFRLFAPGARSVAFWAKLDPGQRWTFPDANISIDGTGEWQKFIIPVAAGSNYLWATIELTHVPADYFWISNATPIYGYTPTLIGSPFSDYTITPANGVNSPTELLTIKAQPIEGYSFENWNQDPSRNDPTLKLTRDDFEILKPQVSKLPTYQEMPGARIEILSEGLMTFPEFDSISFENDKAAIRLEIEGPGRVSYRSNRQGGEGKLSVTMDGKPLYTHYRYSNDPIAPEIKIPLGVHNLEFTYSEETLANNYTVQYLLFEEGSYLEIPQFIRNGSVSVFPNKTFFAKGQELTLSAHANQDYAFLNWGEDWESSQLDSSLTTTLDNHTRIDPKFGYRTSATNGELTWQLAQDPNDNERYSATTIITGPGYFNLSGNWNFEARLDGLEVELQKTEYGAVVTVPPGKHQIQLFSNNFEAQSIFWVAPYVPGLLFAQSNGGGHIQTDPKQQSYLLGAKVSLSLPALSNPEYLQGSLINPGESRSFVVRDHTIVPNNNLRSIGFGFATSAIPNDIDMEVFDGDIAKFRLGSYRSAYPYISKTYSQAGVLTTTLTHLSDQTLEILVNGVSVLTIRENGTYSIQLPPQETTVTWKADSKVSPSNPVLVESIHFEPIFLENTARDIALRIPAHLYATQDGKLGPQDDLDGDGRTNLQEFSEGTPIHIFDLPIQISADQESNPTIHLDLPSRIDRKNLCLMWLKQEDGLSTWEKVGLEELSPQIEIHSNQQTLSFELSPSLLSKLVRFCIITNKQTDP